MANLALITGCSDISANMYSTLYWIRPSADELTCWICPRLLQYALVFCLYCSRLSLGYYSPFRDGFSTDLLAARKLLTAFRIAASFRFRFSLVCWCDVYFFNFNEIVAFFSLSLFFCYSSIKRFVYFMLLTTTTTKGTFKFMFGRKMKVMRCLLLSFFFAQIILANNLIINENVYFKILIK